MEDGEVAHRPRIAERSQMPTKVEVDVHMVIRTNYRDRCPDCVAGRGVSHQHRVAKNEKLGR